jgi:triphosphoribosyl-dephospho-CoA synthase
VLEKAARSRSGVGSLIRKAVAESAKWQKGGNTHFGAFILLIPLIMAAGRCEDIKCLKTQVMDIVTKTSTEDAIEFYGAFSEAKVKVTQVDDLDLSDEASVERIREQGLTLYNLMDISGSYDMIAEEWINGFKKTFECAELIKKKLNDDCINDALVLTFMELLSGYKDTFIQTKFDSKKAEEVHLRAKKIMEKGDIDEIRKEIHTFDEELLKEGVNPGSTADIIISGLFVALFEGLRF